MNATLLKGLLALVPTSMLLAGSIVLFRSRRTVGSFLQLLGAGCLIVVALTHVFEALHLFLWMHWGLEGSNTALVITSISGVLFSVSRYFP